MGDEALLAGVSATILSTPEARLSPNQRVFRLIWELEAEVNNGGFHQYFLNGAGRSALDASEALAAIGARRAAALVDRALGLVNPAATEWPNDLGRRKHMADLDEDAMVKLLEVDAAFYAYPDDLSDLLTRFVVSHPGDFAP
jgi:hypothetical protein